MAKHSLSDLSSMVLSTRKGLGLSAAMMLILFIIIVPMPLWALDTLIGISISSSVIMLMTAINIREPLMFSSYPGALLVTTLFRLALSLTTTRSILADGEAGKIVATFGQTVASGNLVVGMVLFALVTVVQMLVITKGAERVAEVAARFALDAMPGRQMSIDADLRAGLATKDDVLRRRDNVQRESQLYGALDGAMKFVKGDALAGLIFVLVNILGGIAVGVLQQGLSVEEAVRTYTILTIGDGLVTQLPSLLTSITAGFIVTRVRATNGADSIGEQIVDELRAQPRSLMATALLLSLLCFVPGLPSIVFGILALVVGGTGIYSLWSGPRLQNSRVSTAGAGSVALAPAAGGQKLLPTAATPDMLPEDIKFLPVTPILINHNFGEFAARPADGRRLLQEYFLRVYLEQGIPLPAPMTRHDPSLEPGQVVVLVHECVVGRFVIPEGQVMVPMSPIMLRRFGISANVTVGVLGRNSWVAEDLAPQLAAANIPTIPHLEAFAGHVTTLITQSGADFLGIQELREILSKVEQDSPELVKEALKATPLPRMADIIQRLVSERVSVRDMRSILSGFVEWGPREKDPLQLAEHLRGVLRRQICSRLANGQPIIPVHICSAPLERIIRDAIRQTPSGTFLNLSQSEMERVMAGFRESLGDIASRSVLPIVLCSPDIRRFVRKLIERDFADVMVMAFPEMIPELKMQPIGEIMLAD